MIAAIKPLRAWIRALSILAIASVLFLEGHSAAQASAAPPILLIVDPAAVNPFGAYLGEILLAEGMNAFSRADLGDLSAELLARHPLAILAEAGPSDAQATVLRSYVHGGGRLLAMRPDPRLGDLFGLGGSAGPIHDPYLKIDQRGVGGGLPEATLQIHGDADRYRLSAGASIIAQLYSDSDTPSGYPAVVSAAYGTGRSIAFAYDLARSVIYSRQGNPANADRDIDGDGVVRTIDLFQRPAGGAPWVDRNRIAIPQADVQQRLFARLVRDLLGGIMPLPQLWYFPGDAQTMLIVTADSHANPSGAFQALITSLAARRAAATFYLSIAADPSNTELATWQAQGHTFGIHPYAYAPNDYLPYSASNLSEGYTAVERWWGDRGVTVPRSRTVRNHQVAWQGWVDAAALATSHGYLLDTDFYHWGSWLQRPDGSWPYGYITGSGQPMRFVGADGAILPIFQQATQLVDEQLVLGAGSGFNRLNAAQALAVSRRLIDASQAGDYAALVAQFHVDYYSYDARAWAEGTVDYATEQGVPVWNADRWLAFVEARHEAQLTNLAWSSASGALSFDLTAEPAIGVDLTITIPRSYAGRQLASITVDGAPADLRTLIISGRPEQLVSMLAGAHHVVAAYGPPGAPSDIALPLVVR